VKRYFKIYDRKDGEDVLGGPVSEDNAYVRAYAKPLVGQKPPLSLEIGESSRCAFSLSGGYGEYTIIRVEDRPLNEEGR